METLRRYVFPVIWMLIIGVIALSLARMAFFSDAEAGATEDPIVPGGSVDLFATVAVEPGDITSALSLDATVVADAGTQLLSESTGEITKIWVADGDRVGAGDRVLQVRVAQEPEPVDAAPDELAATDPASGTADLAGGTSGAYGTTTEGSGSTGTAASSAAQPTQYLYLNLTAPRSGIVRDLAVEEWEDIAEGDAVATISPGTFSVVASLTPEQQLSLLDREIDATAQISALPDPVTCRSAAIDDEAGAAEDPGTGAAGTAGTSEGGGYDADVVYDEWGEIVDTGSSSGEGSAELRCPLPGDTRVVDGLTGTVEVDLGSAEGVLTVPTTAVEGEGEAGTVYALDDATGEPTPIEVTLGLQGDGIVEIVDGLDEGQEILQFVPGVDNPDASMGGEGW